MHRKEAKPRCAGNHSSIRATIRRSLLRGFPGSRLGGGSRLPLEPLGVADLLKDAPRPVTELAKLSQVNEDAPFVLCAIFPPMIYPAKPLPSNFQTANYLNGFARMYLSPSAPLPSSATVSIFSSRSRSFFIASGQVSHAASATGNAGIRLTPPPSRRGTHLRRCHDSALVAFSVHDCQDIRLWRVVQSDGCRGRAGLVVGGDSSGSQGSPRSAHGPGARYRSRPNVMQAVDAIRRWGEVPVCGHIPRNTGWLPCVLDEEHHSRLG